MIFREYNTKITKNRTKNCDNFVCINEYSFILFLKKLKTDYYLEKNK